MQGEFKRHQKTVFCLDQPVCHLESICLEILRQKIACLPTLPSARIRLLKSCLFLAYFLPISCLFLACLYRHPNRESLERINKPAFYFKNIAVRFQQEKAEYDEKMANRTAKEEADRLRLLKFYVYFNIAMINSPKKEYLNKLY
jgi:hypothetical protein